MAESAALSNAAYDANGNLVSGNRRTFVWDDHPWTRKTVAPALELAIGRHVSWPCVVLRTGNECLEFVSQNGTEFADDMSQVLERATGIAP